ncbi:RHS repeat protein [Dyella jejuensis]|uniref:RHS repeat protein n=1 Tax=Dyella jejuensis TaxID=1432009 RepID=A0ABW8JKU6_9GAMM
MSFSSRVCIGTFFLLGLAAAHAMAQSVTPQDELRTHIGITAAMPLPDAGAFGEWINPITGELTLSQSEAVQSTNGLPLSLTRSFTPGGSNASLPRTGAFADWQLELPRITTLVLNYPDGHGWQVAGANPYARCSAFGPPPTITSADLQALQADQARAEHQARAQVAGSVQGKALNPDAIDPAVWWQGYQLVLPEQGSQEVLKRAAGNTLKPGDTLNYPLVTSRQWQISCLAQTDNDEPGEAFVAIAPNGTSYTFNHLVYQAAPDLAVSGLGTFTRQRASMLVTKIQDRFGNTLNFIYDRDRLVSVNSDNELGFNIIYRSDVPTLIDQVVLRPAVPTPRVWTFHYANLGSGRETLIGVTRPDGNQWTYDLQALAEATLHYTGNTTCDALSPFDAAQTFIGTMTDPNGLTEQLTLGGVRHGRSGVANTCNASADFPWVPAQYDTLSLLQRHYSGANIGTPAWSYQYSDAQASPAWTDIVDPDQHVTRFSFSNAADETEGHVLSMEVNRQADGSASRSIRFDYAPANAGPYPASLGSPADTRMNAAALGNMAPLKQRTIMQDGDTYTTQWKDFNAFAQPTQIHRGNNIAGQTPLDVSVSYVNSSTPWVLGLVGKVTDLANNTVMHENHYDAVRLTLDQANRFGLKQVSYTYNARGLLESSTDGNGLTTHYDNYVLGQPGLITYPDGSSESRNFDAFGNTASFTNRAGVTTTNDYDIMGRITRRGAPKGDGVAWSDTFYRYLYAETPDTGIQGPHWRYGVTRGDSDTITDNDALMRPVLNSSRPGPLGTASFISQSQAYDWRGNAVFSSYPLRDSPSLGLLTQGVHIDYDPLGRAVASHQDSEQGQLTTTQIYLSGARVQTTDPKGATVTTSYQVMDTPSLGDVLRVDAPEGVTQVITRNAYGMPLSITQSGTYQNGQISATRQYVYDGAMRLCRSIQPEIGSTVFDYDTGSRLAWSAQGLAINGAGCGREQVNDAAKTVRNYDAMNNVLSVAYPAGTLSSRFTYDVLGRLASADTGLSRWTYAYNLLGLPTSETLIVDGLAYNLQYGYNANGDLANITYPDGRIVNQSPDAWGRPTQAGDFANAARYLPNGELEYFKYGNGIEYFTEQNARQLPRNLSYALPNGNLLFSQDFSYDANGNLTRADDLAEGSNSQRQFGYDSLNRLTRATAPSPSDAETYSYDPLNNIRSITADTGLQRGFNYDPFNHLNSAVGSDGQTHQFTYDNRGNAIQRDSTPFTFDFANRLTEVSGRESYIYDAFGRRVLKTRLGVGGNKSYYVYDHNGRLILQRDNDVASTETDFIYLGGMLVAQATTRKHDLPGAISFAPGSPSAGTYNVAWGVSEGATTYELEEQYDDGIWTQVYRGPQSNVSYTDRQGGTYLYRVRACSSTCGGWVISSPMGVTPAAINGWQGIHVPAGVQHGAYTISWDPTVSATSYDVDEYDDADWRGGHRVASDLTSNSLQLPGSTNGFYRYRVLAKNVYGGRTWSENSQDVQVELIPSGPPEMPPITTPKPPFDYPVSKYPVNINLSWDAVARASRYEISINDSPAAATGATSYTAALPGYGTWVIGVRACNEDGCSNFSKWGPISTHLPGQPGGPVSVPGVSATHANRASNP